ncbi:hypothetical protein BJ165DRAFT_1492065 [Panaeolus papilionaceus]|nr:hypothetical protein BJ165DRAFT_1492065 [Panaeolus papilionaceus]
MAFLTPTPSPVRPSKLLLNNGQSLVQQTGMINPVEDLVFEDGNLIIIASDPRESRSFKVYEGLMSRHSSVIRRRVEEAKSRAVADPKAITLFAANASASNNNQGPAATCTTIYVAEPPGAMEHFLKALHNLSYFEAPPGQTSMDAIRTILFLSDRYDIPELQRRALAHLYTIYPLTIQEWNKRRHRTNTSNHNAHGVSDLEDRLRLLAIVCRLNSASWALPMLLYDICKFNISTIESHRFWQAAIPTHIQTKIRDGYTPQMELTKEVLSFMLEPNPPECTSREVCLSARCEGAKMIVSWPLNDPVDVWSEGDWEMFGESVCGECMKKLREEYNEHREKAWSQIPRIFGCIVEGQVDENGWDAMQHSFHSTLGSVPMW